MMGEEGEDEFDTNPLKETVWLRKDQIPLLRDFSSAKTIFTLLQEKFYEAGSANNKFLNLAYLFLDMIRIDSKAWGLFMNILEDMKNPDVLAYTHYILEKNISSFHISQVKNENYDNIFYGLSDESFKLKEYHLDYLILFRFTECKRQFAKCLILYFKTMLSFRYWQNDLSYKKDIFTQPIAKTDLPNLKDLIAKKKINSYSCQNSKTHIPCNLQKLGSLKPEREEEFWMDHYVSLQNKINIQDDFEEEEEEEEGSSAHVFVNTASAFVHFDIPQPPKIFIDQSRSAQKLHTFNLLQELCIKQYLPSDIWENAPAMSYFTYCAHRGQIRLSKGEHISRNIDENGRLVTIKDNADSLPLDYFSSFTDREKSEKQRNGLLLKNMSVELKFTGKECAEESSLEEKAMIEEEVLANIFYHCINPELKPYLLLHESDIMHLKDQNTRNSGKLLSYAHTLSKPRKNFGDKTQKTTNTLTVNLDLCNQMQNESNIVSEIIINQFFDQNGFLFCEPTLNLKNLNRDQSWTLDFKWEALEGSKDMLACYILASYLHSFVDKSSKLFWASLLRDSQAGNKIAEKLVQNLTGNKEGKKSFF
jgi:hypothetical protein